MELPANPLWMLLHSWPIGLDRFIFRDIVVNVALYVPAGLTGHLAFRKLRQYWLSLVTPVLICAVFSALIEMVQLFVPSRNTSALDLITNIAGAIVGVFLAALLEEVLLRAGSRVFSRRPPERVALLLLGCWVAWLAFPLFPVMSRTLLGSKFRVFLQPPAMEAVPFVSAAIVWFVAGILFDAGAFRSPRWLTSISVALLPSQFFIVDRQPVPAEIAGAFAGAVCFAHFFREFRRSGIFPRRVLATVFLVVIVIRGLAPFKFLSQAIPFLWIPFGGFLNMNWETGVQVFAEKVFWYGTAIWLLLGAGFRRVAAIGVVAATLLLIEMAQTHLPGRVAEITDPLLAMFAGFALTMLGQISNQLVASTPTTTR